MPQVHYSLKKPPILEWLLINLIFFPQYKDNVPFNLAPPYMVCLLLFAYI